MPDYFFHVAIELFAESGTEREQTEAIHPPSLSQFFKALRPFADPSGRRSARDRSFDQRKEQSKVRGRPRIPPYYEFPHSDSKDHRLDAISLEGSDMPAPAGAKEDAGGKENIIEKGIGSAISGQHMKGRYEPLEGYNGAEGWGLVHLYRDLEETSGLYRDSAYRSSDLWSDGARNTPAANPHPAPKDEDCTTLCILAVPSYMTPSDFLSWVGESTRSDVTHFRMVRTSRANRYMVLIKFKHGKKAREWQYEWNGRVFNSMEPETCHVVFLKSVELYQTSSLEQNSGLSSPTTSYPRMSNDPFISTSATNKPLAPRTPSLVELPTCPVCLERMDETTGLLTIPCQHVFHCTCLEKWSGGGCPVCRYTHDDFSSRLILSKSKSKTTSGENDFYDGPLECEVCHADTSLWQCLICGKVGCGRYDGKHAYAHFDETGHTFSMELESKRVWDYIGDAYVHRIIQDAAVPGEKLVELPGRRREPTALQGQEDVEMAKMDNIALEYTHLLTSQLESQRTYFEEVVERAADKASEASKKAERAMEESRLATERLQTLESEHDLVAKGLVPDLEKERARLEKRSAKFEEVARTMSQKFQEEQALSKSLMARIEHQRTSRIQELQKLKDTIQHLEEDNATKDLLMEGLRDEHRDAMMQISAQQKLQEMVANGELDPEDLEGAVIEAGPAAVKKTALARRAKKNASPLSHGGGLSNQPPPPGDVAPSSPTPTPQVDTEGSSDAEVDGEAAAAGESKTKGTSKKRKGGRKGGRR